MEQHFGRKISELESIVAFLTKASLSYGLDSAAQFALHMAVEELYTNMVKYNQEGAEKIAIRVNVQNQALYIDLIDFDSRPFDYKKKTNVDVSVGLNERTPGGLGIHLVERFMDEVNYEYDSGITSIRMVKNLTTHA